MTRKDPPPALSVTMARKRVLTAQKWLSCTFLVMGIPSKQCSRLATFPYTFRNLELRYCGRQDICEGPGETRVRLVAVSKRGPGWTRGGMLLPRDAGSGPALVPPSGEEKSLQESCVRPCARGHPLLTKPYRSKEQHEASHTFLAAGTHAHSTFQKGCRVLSLPRDVPCDRADHPPQNPHGLPPVYQKLLSSVQEGQTEKPVCSERTLLTGRGGTTMSPSMCKEANDHPLSSSPLILSRASNL